MNKHLDFSSLEALYASMPKISCKGLCYDYCGIISVEEKELDFMKAKVPGFVDKFDKSPPADRMIEIYLTPKVDFNPLANRCPYLTPENKCSIYEARPAICRIWGLINSFKHVQMRCPWGCRPERWLTDDETQKILAFIRT